jgi:hypothetical protein
MIVAPRPALTSFTLPELVTRSYRLFRTDHHPIAQAGGFHVRDDNGPLPLVT